MHFQGEHLPFAAQALAAITGGSGSASFTFFLLPAPGAVPDAFFFFGVVNSEALGAVRAKGPGIPSPPSPLTPGITSFLLAFFFCALVDDTALIIWPRGPILIREGSGASSGNMTGMEMGAGAVKERGAKGRWLPGLTPNGGGRGGGREGIEGVKVVSGRRRSW